MKNSLALVAGVLALGCGQTDPDLGEAREAIIGGAPDPGDSPVLMLVSYPPDHTTFDTCTASLVSPTVLLTAAHCVDPQTHPGHLFGVFPGDDASAYTSANTLIPKLLALAEVHAHPDYDRNAPFKADIAVAILEQPLARTPLVFNRTPLDADIVGMPARIVGFGQTKYKTYNAVRYAVDTVVADLPGDDTVTVGDLEHRSCVGDSGGPAIVVMNGEPRIIGVDSYTDLEGCLEPAHYRRPDMYTTFLDAYVPPETPPDTRPEPLGTTGDASCQVRLGKTRGDWPWGLFLAVAMVMQCRRSKKRPSTHTA